MLRFERKRKLTRTNDDSLDCPQKDVNSLCIGMLRCKPEWSNRLRGLGQQLVLDLPFLVGDGLSLVRLHNFIHSQILKLVGWKKDRKINKSIKMITQHRKENTKQKMQHSYVIFRIIEVKDPKYNNYVTIGSQ